MQFIGFSCAGHTSADTVASSYDEDKFITHQLMGTRDYWGFSVNKIRILDIGSENVKILILRRGGLRSQISCRRPLKGGFVHNKNGLTLNCLKLKMDIQMKLNGIHLVFQFTNVPHILEISVNKIQKLRNFLNKCSSLSTH